MMTGRRHFLAAGGSAVALAAAGVRAAGKTSSAAHASRTSSSSSSTTCASTSTARAVIPISKLRTSTRWPRAARRSATPITRRRCARRIAPASSPASTRRATASSTTRRARTRAIGCPRSHASCSARGYETAHVGKWHMGNDPTPRPGYDYWVSFAGPGRHHRPGAVRERPLAARSGLHHRPAHRPRDRRSPPARAASPSCSTSATRRFTRRSCSVTTARWTSRPTRDSFRPQRHRGTLRGQDLQASAQLRALRAGSCGQAGAGGSAGREALRRHRAPVRSGSPR